MTSGMFRGISGNVLVLGFVSFLTDVSSEMIYPLLPLFLTTVLGAGPSSSASSGSGWVPTLTSAAVLPLPGSRRCSRFCSFPVG